MAMTLVNSAELRWTYETQGYAIICRRQIARPHQHCTKCGFQDNVSGINSLNQNVNMVACDKMLIWLLVTKCSYGCLWPVGSNHQWGNARVWKQITLLNLNILCCNTGARVILMCLCSDKKFARDNIHVRRPYIYIWSFIDRLYLVLNGASLQWPRCFDLSCYITVFCHWVLTTLSLCHSSRSCYQQTGTTQDEHKSISKAASSE